MQHNGYVQYGCGPNPPVSWTNFDASPTSRIEKIPLLGPAIARRVSMEFGAHVRYGDIVKGLPIAPESCTAIYCSHVLEHLSLNDMRSALRNTYKCLRPGGIFRCVLPDLEYCINDYLKQNEEQPAVVFMNRTLLGYTERPRRLSSFVRNWLGNSRHLWMWDYRSLAAELEKAGFVSIRRAAFGDAEDPMFRDVEDRQRWENCLGIECRKPS